MKQSPRPNYSKLRSAVSCSAFLVLVSRQSAGLQAEPTLRAVPSTIAKTLVTHAALGATVASIRAVLGGRGGAKATTQGAVGGAIHGAAKVIAGRYDGAGPAVALLTSSFGIGLINTAGLGASPLQEFSVPVWPVRVNVVPRSSAPIRLSVSAFEVAVVLERMVHEDLSVDWRHTLGTGSVILRTRHGPLLVGGRPTNAVTIGGVVIVSSEGVDPKRIRRHEMVHAQQYYFLKEAIGRPIEATLRSRWDSEGRVPNWLDLDVFEPLLTGTDLVLFRERGLWGLRETEARRLAPGFGVEGDHGLAVLRQTKALQ